MSSSATLDESLPDEPPAPAGKADITAWLGVAAGAIGSLMATLDISIVNASLPTIQGEIGASSSEGTWIATAYLVAEIIIIPLTGWLERVFGLRRFLMIATVLFTAFVNGTASDPALNLSHRARRACVAVDGPCCFS